MWSPDRELLKKCLEALKANNIVIQEEEYSYRLANQYATNDFLIIEVEQRLTHMGILR